jgi:hypothetical protein
MAQHIQPETSEFKEKEAFLEAGADYVIQSLSELKELIRLINSRLVFRESKLD